MAKLIIAQWVVAVIIVLIGGALRKRTKPALTTTASLTGDQVTTRKAPLWSISVKYSLVLTAIYLAAYAYLKLNYFAKEEGLFTSYEEARSETWMMIVGHIILGLPRVFVFVFVITLLWGLHRNWRKP